MRIFVVAEKVADDACSTQAPALVCAIELAHRGVEVTLACESIHSDARAEAERAGVRVIARGPFCYRKQTSARAFASFIGGLMGELGTGWVSVSFSALVAADVWAPLSNREPVADTRLEDAIHDTVLLRSFRRRAAEALARRGAGVRRFLAFGPLEAMPEQPHREFADVTINIGYVATTPVPPVPARAELRRRVRDLLEISAGAKVFLLSADGRSAEDLHPILSAIGHLHHQRRADAPTLLVISPEPTSVQQAAGRAGLSELPGALRVTSPTTRVDALLSAADAMASVTPTIPGQYASPARLLCDALSFGLPVLAAHDAPGAPLIARAIRSGEGPHPGLLVSDNTPIAWYRAIDHAMHADFRTQFDAVPASRATSNPLPPLPPLPPSPPRNSGVGTNGGASQPPTGLASPSATTPPAPVPAARALADLHLLSVQDFVDRVHRACAGVFASAHL